LKLEFWILVLLEPCLDDFWKNPLLTGGLLEFISLSVF
jgi:hypothetical protein